MSVVRALLLASLLLARADPSGARAVAQETSPGAPVEDFCLTATDGERLSLWSRDVSVRATLVVLYDANDEHRLAHAQRCIALAREFGPRGLRVLLVSPRMLARDELSALASLPACLHVLEDPTQVVARRIGLEFSLDALVVGAELELRQRGASLGKGEDVAQPRFGALRDLVATLLEGASPPPLEPGPRGSPVRLDAPERPVTYFQDVSPLVRAHCAECHRVGGAGPMDLTDVDEARGWAPMMAEATTAGYMPPWHADPRWGSFRNERRLTDSEKEILRRFAAQGAPAGEPPPKSGAAATTSSASEWTIGTPDLVLELPQPEEIPAEGVLPYRSALIHTNFTEEKWVEAIECQPTAKQVTHHLVLMLVPDSVPDEKAAELSTTFPDAAIGGYVPGGPALFFAPGYARRLPKAARLVCSLHYTPNGKPAVDRTRIAFRFARGPVQHEVHGGLLATQKIDIPPETAGVQCYAVQRIEKPIELLSFGVHMHARGSAFRYEVLHEGQRRVLLDIPHFDWYWQQFYQLREPVRIEAGDLLIGIATYDNSRENKRNPDPTQRVKNGPQSNDEMMNGAFHYIQSGS